MLRGLGVLLGAALVGAALAGRCQRITAPACLDVGYNVTSMPNSRGHENQEQVTLQLLRFHDRLNHECSPFLRLFVCSVYVPFCSEETADTVPPCRGFCEEVYKNCETATAVLWYKGFNCSVFPEASKHVLCMQPQAPLQQDVEHLPEVDLMPMEQTSRRVEHCPYGMAMSEDKCLKLCYTHSDDWEDKKRHAFLELWTAVWSFICLIITTFALLTFAIQPKRFRWPARPILYLTICGFITSLVYLLRWLEGPLTCSGQTELAKPSDSLTCIAAALVLLFCELAFALWWCVFCLAWFLSAAKEWSTEAIEKCSTHIHACVWTLSSIAVLYTLLTNDIVANQRTGLCQVKSRVQMTVQFVAMLVGAVLAVVTSVALKNVRRALVYLYAGRSPFKLERLIYRLCVTNVGICVPLSVSLLCIFFDTQTSVLVKVATRLLSAIFAALWVVSSKTFKKWNKILRPPMANKEVREIPVAKV